MTFPVAAVLAGAAAALGWISASSALDAPSAGAPLPTLTLTTAAGAPTTLAQQAAGRPLVLNLWATWCPPCRREMPLLAEAQRTETDLSFVFADQGESPAAVARYLDEAELQLRGVLLDEAASLGPAVGAAGLPTTLFYDARGRLVGRHVGALSPAALGAKLAALRAPGAAAAIP